MTAESEGRVRLTKAQRALLERLARCDQPVRANGRVVTALRIAGYADFDDRAGDGLWWFTITPAGRRALETSHDK